MASQMKSAGKTNRSSDPGATGIAPLGGRHRARVEPGVDDRLHPPHLRDGRRGPRPQSGHGKVTSSMAGRWGSTSVTSRPASSESSASEPTHRMWPSVAPPDRERGAPEPVAGQGPVDVVGQPLPHPAVPDVLGVPADGLVLGHQVGLAVRGPDVPAGLAPVDQRGAAAPAVGVGVDDTGWRRNRRPGRLQAVVDLAVGVPHRRPSSQRHRGGEPAVGPDRVEGGEVVLAAHLAVDLAEGGGQVDDAGALVGLDEVAGHHPPAVPAGRARERGHVVEGPEVVQPDQRRPGQRRCRIDRALAEHLLHQVGGHDASSVRTTAYSRSGPTAAPVLDSSVQGVVVQATRESPARACPGPRAARSRPAASPSSVRGSARRPTRPPPPGRRRAGRARGWTARSRTAGSRGRP